MFGPLLHPIVVHLPLALAVLVPPLALGLLALIRGGALPARAIGLATVFQALLVGSGVLALQTGEVDEEVVEAVVAEGVIEAHEEAAEQFVWGGALVLGLFVVATAAARRGAGLGLGLAAAAASVVVAGLAVRTGSAGGALVYEHGAAQAFVTRAAGAQPQKAQGALPGEQGGEGGVDDDD